MSCSKELSVSEPMKVPVNYKLSITSNPTNALIFINDKNYGQRTPDTIEFLDDSLYTLRLRLPYYNDLSIKVKPDSDKIPNYTIDFFSYPESFGKIYCTSNVENAEVFLNDSSTGFNAPVLLERVIPGKYTITAKKAEHVSISNEITVYSSKKTRIRCNLIDTSKWVVYGYKFYPIERAKALSVGKDSDNNIWAYFKNIGLYKIKRNKITFYDDTKLNFLPCDIYDIKSDRVNGVWFATSKGIIHYYDNTYKIFNETNSLLPNTYPVKIEIDENNTLYIPTSKGVLIYKNGVWKDIPIFKDIYIRSIAKFQNKIVVSTSDATFLSVGDLNSFLLINNRGATHVRFDQNGSMYMAFPMILSPTGNVIEKASIVHYSNGNSVKVIQPNVASEITGLNIFGENVCVSTTSGLFILKNNSVVKNYDITTNFPSIELSDAQKLYDNELWLSTYDKGVLRVKVDKIL